jgi:hypothetical protein
MMLQFGPGFAQSARWVELRRCLRRRTDVRYWHKADMLNALANVRFWEKTGHLTNRRLSTSIYEYMA